MGPKQSEEIPKGEITDNSYTTSGKEEVPVIADEQVSTPEASAEGNPDSDSQLEMDEKEAINKNNILDERTRHAKPVESYREPGDEEGLERTE